MGQKKILVVEDEVKITHFIKKGLEMENFNVDLAHSGAEGLSKAEIGDYNLIILDIMLPEIDGLEICRRLRKKMINTPIIFLTAKDTIEDRVLGLAAGADEYLVKPFTLRELVFSIRAMLEKEKIRKVINSESNSIKTAAYNNILTEEILNTSNSSVVIDHNGKIKSANKAFKEQIGYHLQELLDTSIFRYIDPIDRFGVMKSIKKIFEGNITFTKGLNCKLIAKDGKVIPVEYELSKIIKYEKISQIQLEFKSTETISAENDKRDRLAEFNKKIMDNVPVSIITIDKYGYITSANKYYEYFAKDKNYHNHNIFTSEFFIRENLVNDYKKLLSDGQVVKKENCYEKNNKGEDKYLKIIAVPLRNSEGKIEGALSMALDDTETVLYKKKLQELNKDLELKVKQRTIKLDEANRELKRVLQSQSTFMEDASHELRTSLSIIQGNLELIDQELVNGNERDQTYENIYNEIKRMSEMLADLSSLNTSDANSNNLNHDKFGVNSLLSSVCGSIKPLADKKNVVLECPDTNKDIEITADKAKMEKMFLNIIRNAIRFNHENGWVKIKTEKNDEGLIISVEDNGIGIGKDHLPYIFERFYRVDKARSRKEGGSGLGLAISKWVAEIHGGKIEVDSGPGRGSRFIIYLPNGIMQAVASNT